MTDYFEGVNDKKRFLQPVLTSERKKEKQVRVGYTEREIGIGYTGTETDEYRRI